MSFFESAPEFKSLLEVIKSRKGEQRFHCEFLGEAFVFGPGKLTVIGAPPATGKTALVNQIAFEVLATYPDVSVVLANCEMDIRSILLREVSRQSKVMHQHLGAGTWDHVDLDRIESAAEFMNNILPRCRYMEGPFDCESLSKLTTHAPGILIVDYLQKFRANEIEARTGVDAVISLLRTLTLNGWAVIALSSTSRQQGGKNGGHSHQGLSMSSYKESGEIEFNADAAYLLRDMSTDPTSKRKEIQLDCVKNRNAAPHQIELTFFGDYMQFEIRETKDNVSGQLLTGNRSTGGFPKP